jgi:thymidylate synthase (FAD)
MYEASCDVAFGTYNSLLVEGWPRELARAVLPVATYSHMFATVNLLNLFRFLELRLHAHAQYEIRVYAEAMLELVRAAVPVCHSAFSDTISKASS